jgi:ribosomal protein RSM22 (predicted rRNA methylase)
MQLPPARLAALNALLEGISRKDLARRVETQSAAYRGGGTSAGIASGLDAMAYAVARAPATYAAVRAALGRVLEVMPDFAPASLLDVGAGPGTASWAAADLWPGVAITMLDHNPHLRALAAQVMGEATILAGDAGSAKPKADLVVASYVLAEFSEPRAADLAVDVWASAHKVLMLVEPGTPPGFARIRDARAALIEAGAHVVAPCTHDNACPMPRSVGESRSDQNQPDWCHFSQRLSRSRDHMIAKEARVPFEDERYAYVAVTREAVAQGARVIKPAVENKPGMTLPLCDETGLRDEFVARRDKETFRRARKLEWGDLFRADQK